MHRFFDFPLYFFVGQGLKGLEPETDLVELAVPRSGNRSRAPSKSDIDSLYIASESVKRITYSMYA